MFNMAQMGGLAIALAVAGFNMEKVGDNLFIDASRDNVYSDNHLCEALARVSSIALQSRGSISRD